MGGETSRVRLTDASGADLVQLDGFRCSNGDDWSAEAEAMVRDLPEWVEAGVDNNRHVFLLHRGAQLIAVAAWEYPSDPPATFYDDPTATAALLWVVGVIEGHQGSGYGPRMVDTCIAAAAGAGASVLWGLTHERNTNGLKVAHALGGGTKPYRPYGRATNYILVRYTL